MEAHFTVISGPFRGQSFQVPRGKFVLGREQDCHLALNSNSVSRHHCVLLLDDYTLRVRDLASKNGTFVNRDLNRIGERILSNGDTVRLGDLVIRVEVELGASRPAGPLETKNLEPDTKQLDLRLQESDAEQSPVSEPSDRASKNRAST